jgi:chromosome partitioning protein
VAHIIVLGNEKGGSGKSTTAMHVATALARLGKVVGGLDLDLRQRSFGRYIENRQNTIAKRQLDLPCPILMELPPIDPATLGKARTSTTSACRPPWPSTRRNAISS